MHKWELLHHQTGGEIREQIKIVPPVVKNVESRGHNLEVFIGGSKKKKVVMYITTHGKI